MEYFRRNSAASRLSPDDAAGVDFGAVRHLHATGIPPAVSVSCRELSWHMLEKARAAGASISFDPNLRPGLWASEDEMCETLNAMPALEAELGAEHRQLDALLAEADFVCITVPLTAETEHLIGAREFARMKPSAIFVNIARGKVVDEAALIAALEKDEILAAGLDVFEQEPLSPESPLPHMPNVVALPHIGSATHETRTAMAQRAVDNIRLALEGNRPISLVNEAAWEQRQGS